MVLSHVNQLSGLLDRLECSLDHRLWVADKGYHSSVGSLTWVNV